MITVASVYRMGGAYDEVYVERLAAGVRRTLSLPHRFVCLTDSPKKNLEHCLITSVIPLKQSWPGWWAKMELFGLPGPVLYFDLDTVLVGSIDDLARWVMETKDVLLMLRDFYTRDRSSGILGWNGDLRWVLDSFERDYANRAAWRRSRAAISMFTGRERFRGDQDWLRFFLPGHSELLVALVQNVVSGIYSYKVHVRGREDVPDDARIICFHGRPRPREVENIPWMKKNWSDSIEVLAGAKERAE